jgi:KipI family sensor histidine kinase inhibitor
MKWRQYGRNGVLIEFAEKPDEWAFHKSRTMVEALTRKPPVRLVEFVPGFTTILLEFDLGKGDRLDALASETIHFLEGAVRSKPVVGPLRTISVKYNGPDLERVAQHNRITVAQVIKYHCEPKYKVYLLGFSPGFPYLAGLHHKLETPRLETPRPRIRAGSVAIGGKHTGIYSIDSPGGWNIIGHTEVKIFDRAKLAPGQEEGAFFLKPGDEVRFTPVV